MDDPRLFYVYSLYGFEDESLLSVKETRQEACDAADDEARYYDDVRVWTFSESGECNDIYKAEGEEE